jgi:hypothetical protein
MIIKVNKNDMEKGEISLYVYSKDLENGKIKLEVNKTSS